MPLAATRLRRVLRTRGGRFLAAALIRTGRDVLGASSRPNSPSFVFDLFDMAMSHLRPRHTVRPAILIGGSLGPPLTDQGASMSDAAHCWSESPPSPFRASAVLASPKMTSNPRCVWASLR